MYDAAIARAGACVLHSFYFNEVFRLVGWKIVGSFFDH